MKIMQGIITNAKQKKGKIILPEANLDSRVYDACKIILKQGLAEIIVLGCKNEYSFGSNAGLEIIDIKNYHRREEMIDRLYDLRKAKGLSREEADRLLNQPEYFATMLLSLGVADAMVAGAHFSTADTLRPALQIIKTRPGKSIVVGAMLMLKDDVVPLCFSDVSLNVNPNAAELAEIAISSAELFKRILNTEPKIAMLSYSTKGSAKSDMVDKVCEATEIAKNKSSFLIDGEMQADSALDIQTAKKKGITSEVGGNANVLIFPDINSANISYKLVSRLAGYEAIGPVMLNFNKPVNDLSRGCTVDEIISTVAITKLLI